MATNPHWLATRAAVLEIETPGAIRSALASWPREYGLANGHPSLLSGNLERRMAWLCRARADSEVVMALSVTYR